MRTIIRIAILLLLATTAVQAREIDVDCDAGDDLGAVLNRLAIARPTGLAVGENSDAPDQAITINISGTCVGNFVITTTGLNLQGVGPGPDAAVLQGAAPMQSVTPVLEIRGAVGTALRDLTITGASRGLVVRHADALVLDCEFRGNTIGIHSESSRTLISGSLFTDNLFGIESHFGDFVSLNDSSVVGNDQVGIEVAAGSSLLIDGGEISGNQTGIRMADNSSAFLRAPLVLGETTGGAHIDAVNHCTVTLNDSVVVSGSGGIQIVNNSLLQGYEATIEAGVDIVLHQFGHAALRETAVEGDMQLHGFSNAVLTNGASVAGQVSCDATSDADCSGGTVGAASGCAHCTPVASDR